MTRLVAQLARATGARLVEAVREALRDSFCKSVRESFREACPASTKLTQYSLIFYIYKSVYAYIIFSNIYIYI